MSTSRPFRNVKSKFASKYQTKPMDVSTQTDPMTSRDRGSRGSTPRDSHHSADQSTPRGKSASASSASNTTIHIQHANIFMSGPSGAFSAMGSLQGLSMTMPGSGAGSAASVAATPVPMDFSFTQESTRSKRTPKPKKVFEIKHSSSRRIKTHATPAENLQAETQAQVQPQPPQSVLGKNKRKRDDSGKEEKTLSVEQETKNDESQAKRHKSEPEAVSDKKTSIKNLTPAKKPEFGELKSKIHKSKFETISEKEFIQRITACIAAKITNFEDRLKYIFKGATYKIRIEGENTRGEVHPLIFKIDKLEEFREQKERKDKSGQSWLVKNLKELSTYHPGYKPTPLKAGAVQSYEWTLSQLCDQDYYRESKNREVSRGYTTADDYRIAEWHTLSKGYCSANPIPGKSATRLTKHIFRLFQPKVVLFADSSYQRPAIYMTSPISKSKEVCVKRGILLRVWEVLKSGETWYQQQITKTDSIFPADVSPVKMKGQNEKEYLQAVAYLQKLPIKEFYERFDGKQKAKLMNAYNNCELSKAGPLAKSSCNLSQLVVAVDAASKKLKNEDDYDLNELICDGIDILEENQYLKGGKKKNDKFQLAAFQLIWGAYYGQMKPLATPMESAKASAKGEFKEAKSDHVPDDTQRSASRRRP